MNNNYQWFIITVIGGQEDSITNSLREKINNYGFQNDVKDIKVLKEEIIIVDEFTKSDPNVPSTLKNTKTTKWEVLPNGHFKRTKSKIVNRFPGYVFINMIMGRTVWHAVRNTIGVLGFVGSTGKGALPIPITDDEYERMIGIQSTKTPIEENKNVENSETKVEKKIVECNFKVGQNVIIKSANLDGEIAKVIGINLEKGVATVEYEFFSRAITTDVPIAELELEK